MKDEGNRIKRPFEDRIEKQVPRPEAKETDAEDGEEGDED